MIAAQTSMPRKHADWLKHFGWEAVDRLPSEYRLQTSNGAAVLKQSSTGSQSAWQEWILEFPGRRAFDPKGLFVANGQLLGPWKFAVDEIGDIVCRGDVPRDVLVTDDAFDLATGQTSSPLECWAEASTALATGAELPHEQPKPSTPSLVDWLKEHGFVASADGDKVKVTVPLCGAFREVAVHWQDNGFAELRAEIGRLEKWPKPSRKAAEDFLNEANRRLRLARISQPEESQVFSMEVCFRAPGPGVWLQSALEALCTGMALVVQPLASLRDPGVADMLLAGNLANE